eukprot:10327346-Lingulodinium_polyedra.AAC.1
MAKRSAAKAEPGESSKKKLKNESHDKRRMTVAQKAAEKIRDNYGHMSYEQVDVITWEKLTLRQQLERDIQMERDGHKIIWGKRYHADVKKHYSRKTELHTALSPEKPSGSAVVAASSGHAAAETPDQMPDEKLVRPMLFKATIHETVFKATIHESTDNMQCISVLSQAMREALLGKKKDIRGMLGFMAGCSTNDPSITSVEVAGVLRWAHGLRKADKKKQLPACFKSHAKTHANAESKLGLSREQSGLALGEHDLLEVHATEAFQAEGEGVGAAAHAMGGDPGTQGCAAEGALG